MLKARNLYLIKHSMKPLGNYEKITINLIRFHFRYFIARFYVFVLDRY